MNGNLSTEHTRALRVGTSWRLDPTRSEAEFRVPHFWGLATVRGRFHHLDGRLEMGQDGQRRIELNVDAASVDTGNRKRDEHLRSSEFFDAQRHPRMSFRSTSVSDAGDGRLHVEGRLAAAGNEAPVELEATLSPAGDRLEIEANTTVDQRVLGMTWSPLGIARAPTIVRVHAWLLRQA